MKWMQPRAGTPGCWAGPYGAVVTSGHRGAAPGKSRAAGTLQGNAGHSAPRAVDRADRAKGTTAAAAAAELRQRPSFRGRQRPNGGQPRAARRGRGVRGGAQQANGRARWAGWRWGGGAAGGPVSEKPGHCGATAGSLHTGRVDRGP